ncbi:hypothetical protein ACFVSX_32955 [Streptomyces rubiginosohelvolus]|uniref:hypothetical protein n=1 Tax=Streptomyces rubiginosohelvolus TaxID=67362 RepID=UPI0036DD06C9
MSSTLPDGGRTPSPAGPGHRQPQQPRRRRVAEQPVASDDDEGAGLMAGQRKTNPAGSTNSYRADVLHVLGTLKVATAD